MWSHTRNTEITWTWTRLFGRPPFLAARILKEQKVRCLGQWDIGSANHDLQFFMMCSLEQTHIHDIQSLGTFVLKCKISTCLSQPREARARWPWWRDRRPSAPRACSHSGSRRPTPRSPRWTWPTWGTNVSHKWSTWVVVRTNADKTSKSSPCDEEGSPCQSLPLGNSGSCQVLQPLGIATTHLVWNIFYTISRNCKKHLSVVFKNDFSKLLNPIFWNILQEIFIIEMGWQSD